MLGIGGFILYLYGIFFVLLYGGHFIGIIVENVGVVRKKRDIESYRKVQIVL